VLARLAERDGLLGRGHELERDQRDAERLAVRQAAARGLARELGLDAQLGSAPASGLVARELDAVEREVQDAEAAARPDPASDPRPRIAELRAGSRRSMIGCRLAPSRGGLRARLAGFAPPPPRALTRTARDRVIEASGRWRPRRARGHARAHRPGAIGSSAAAPPSIPSREAARRAWRQRLPSGSRISTSNGPGRGPPRPAGDA
jgi:hypothetical protein